MSQELPIIDAEIVEEKALPTDAELVEAIQLSPEQLEKKMLEQDKRRAEEADPEEMASMMLTLYTPRFCSQVDKLSSRQLRRLIKSIVEYPVGRDYKHTDKTEAECFAIGRAWLDAKYVLIASTYSHNGEKILQMAAEAAGKEGNNEQ